MPEHSTICECIKTYIPPLYVGELRSSCDKRSSPRLVTVRDVLEVTNPVRTSVSRIAFSPPSITPGTPIYDASLKLVHNRIRILPVVENESIIGVVRQTKILEKMVNCEDLKECTSEELMVENPVTVDRDSSTGVIRSIMLRRGISHTPVVDPDGKLRGIITAKDLSGTLSSQVKAKSLEREKGRQLESGIWV